MTCLQAGCVVHLLKYVCIFISFTKKNASNIYVEILYSRDLDVNMTRLKTKLQVVLLLAVCQDHLNDSPPVHHVALFT